MTEKYRMDEEGLLLFKKMFGTLHDALIWQVSLKPLIRKKDITVEIALGAMRHDIEILDFPDRWINLNIQVQMLDDIKIVVPPNTWISFISRAEIEVHNKLVILDFFPNMEKHKSNNLREESRREASLRIIGKSCEWWISSYKDYREV